METKNSNITIYKIKDKNLKIENSNHKDDIIFIISILLALIFFILIAFLSIVIQKYNEHKNKKFTLEETNINLIKNKKDYTFECIRGYVFIQDKNGNLIQMFKNKDAAFDSAIPIKCKEYFL